MKILLVCALMSTISLIGCSQEHQVSKHDQEQQEKDNRESGLDWYGMGN